ncbi:MAG: arsenate reductase [Oceanicoccus sp.]|jgi:arsenate reductase
MSDFVIYHNSRCSKSRQTLALLEEAGIKAKAIYYLETPPNVEELANLAKLLGMRPIEFTRTKDSDFKALGLKTDEISDEQVLELLASNPKLIERPIVVKDGKKAILGRPPENVMKLI